jgi:shikimate 5-dehydrogenase
VTAIILLNRNNRFFAWNMPLKTVASVIISTTTVGLTRSIGDHLHEKVLFQKHIKAVVMAVTPPLFQEAKKKYPAQQPGTTKGVRMPRSKV